jgi:dynactin 1
MESVAVGTRVSTANGNGTVRFTGSTAFAAGRWIGVELDAPNGKNSGSVQGRAYFTCRDGCGVFVRPTGIKAIVDVAPPKRKSTEDPRARVCAHHQLARGAHN